MLQTYPKGIEELVYSWSTTI